MGPAVEMSGGSAANTLAGLVSLGGAGAYIGKVRNDQLGGVFSHDLRAAGVDYRSWPADSGPPTARCLIFVTDDAQRTMQTYLGVSVELGPGDIDPEAVGSAHITYLEGYLFDRQEAKQAFVKAAEIAHAAGRRVALTLSDPFCVDRHRGEFRACRGGHRVWLDGLRACRGGHLEVPCLTFVFRVVALCALQPMRSWRKR